MAGRSSPWPSTRRTWQAGGTLPIPTLVPSQVTEEGQDPTAQPAGSPCKQWPEAQSTPWIPCVQRRPSSPWPQSPSVWLCDHPELSAEIHGHRAPMCGRVTIQSCPQRSMAFQDRYGSRSHQQRPGFLGLEHSSGPLWVFF